MDKYVNEFLWVIVALFSRLPMTNTFLTIIYLYFPDMVMNSSKKLTSITSLGKTSNTTFHSTSTCYIWAKERNGAKSSLFSPLFLKRFSYLCLPLSFTRISPSVASWTPSSLSPSIKCALHRLVWSTGFVQLLGILESPCISRNDFPGLESPGILMQVLESLGNLNWATSFY